MNKITVLSFLLVVAHGYLFAQTEQQVHVHIKIGAYYAPFITKGVYEHSYFKSLSAESSRTSKPWTYEVMVTKRLRKRHELQIGISYQSLPLDVKSYLCGVAPPCEPYWQHYHIQFLGIPVHHGYRLLRSRRVNMTINNGLQPTYSLDNKEEELLPPWSLAFKSELMFTFAINDKYGISISPFINKTITSLHKEDKFRPFIFGGMLGVFIGADERQNSTL